MRNEWFVRTFDHRHRLVSTDTERGVGLGPPSKVRVISVEGTQSPPAAPRSASTESLDSYGLDRAIAEANEEHPGLLVGELSVEENRRRLEELQQTLWGEAA